MFQKFINHNVDHYYNLQIKETEHQNHRLTWIFAAQSIIFVGLCTLIAGKDLYTTVLIWLLCAIGISLAFSGLYSVLVGELSIGTILEQWDAYNRKKNHEKYREVPHQVILAPSIILKSKLRFLLLYSFAPKVFCAGWITLFAFYITNKYLNLPIENQNLTIIGIYLISLIIICVVAAYAGKYLLYKWFYCDTKEKQSKNDDEVTVNQIQTIQINGCNSKFNNKNSNLRIYHILVDRFNGGWTTPPKNENKFLGGNLKGISDKIEYIAAQGFNAILLTPIFKSAAYHGYHTIDYLQIDPHFGDWNDFQELICKAHAHNIKVMCDFVPNHCHIDNQLFREAYTDQDNSYRQWFYFDESRKGGFVSYQNYPDLPKVNLYNDAAATWMIRNALNLAKYGIDGLRIDHAIGVPFKFLRNLNTALKCINPEILVFGEAWAPDNGIRDISQIELINNQRKTEIIEEAENLQENMQLDYVGVLDGVLDFEYRNIIIREIECSHRILGNRDLMRRLEAHFSNYPQNFTLLLFLDNHDTNRILHICNGDRSLVNEAVELTQSLPYPSIIYYGTEKYMTNITDICPDSPYSDLNVREPMDWN